MTKELQGLAWSCLPKEFKEEVKKYYDNSTALAATAVLLLENLFGVHNLTSDVEEEEMLICHKEQICKFYSHLLDLVEKNRTSKYYSEWCDLEREYIALFGDKPFTEYFKSHMIL